MTTSIVRTRIAGSVSAVAALSLFTTTGTAHAAEECAPIHIVNSGGTAAIAYPDFCGGEVPAPGTFPFFIPFFPIDLGTHLDGPVLADPPICEPLELTNLEARAAQTSPDDWQWRFWINGDTSNLCDNTLVADMLDNGSGLAAVQYISVWNIVDVNNEGGDYVVTFAAPCEYGTAVAYGPEFLILDQYVNQVKTTDVCSRPASEDAAPEVISPAGIAPVDPGPEGTVPEGTVDTVPVSEEPAAVETAEPTDGPIRVDTAMVPGTPTGNNLPRTGSDSTALLMGDGMVVLGLGLAATAVGMTRKRRIA